MLYLPNMNLLSVSGLVKTYGERLLFEELSFGLANGDKAALIAQNGKGKTTLLNIIAGLDIGDKGDVVFRNGVRVGYLKQNPQLDETLTIHELVTSANNRISKIIQEYENAISLQVNGGSMADEALQLATSKMDEEDVWDYEIKTKQITTLFGIDDWSKKISELSGGQVKRLSLALVLIDNPELLILDEPTNHLDVEMIEWLEKYLSQPQITVLMVTHDRYFLDRVCNNIFELEDNKLYRHKGNYAYFLNQRALREDVSSTEKEKAVQLMKKELEWLRKMPKARTTKAKIRIKAFDDIKGKATKKVDKSELQLDVKMTRMGGKILELKKVYKSYGDKVILKAMDYTFKKNERIGIIGNNGVGKSTFLNIVTEKEPPDSGKINIGETIIYGYYSQNGITLKSDMRVIQVLKDIAEVIVISDGSKITASQLLQHFMFDTKQQHTFVSKLSGGERRRLYLLTVLIKNPNFLILDEPTNDLDLLTLNKLEEFLLNFKGCLLIVSHDRYFMDKLAEHLFYFEGDGKISDHYCTYSQFREKLKKKPQENSIKKTNKSVKGQSKKKHLTYAEILEYKKLEKEIHKLEKEKDRLSKFFEDAGTDYEKLTELGNKINEITTIIDNKTERWMLLAELSDE